MKIFCYVYDSLKNPVLGGGGVYREVNLHKVLAVRHSITFFSGYFPGCSDYTENGLAFKYLGFGRNYYISRISFALFATLHSLVHSADLFVISFSVYSPVLTFLFKPRRTVIQFYHFTGKNAFAKYGIFGIFPYLAEKLVLRTGQHFITMAQGIADILIKKYSREAVATFTGIDDNLRNETAPEGGYILSFGRIDVRMKGLDILFDIFDRVYEKHPTINLVVAGRGVESDMRFVRDRIARSSHRERIQFVENPTYAQKCQLLRDALAVVIPSRFEGWNIVAIEAAANGKPVIGSNIPGLSEAVKDGETGFLCTTEDVDGFARTLATVLNDPQLRRRMGTSAYQWAKEFTWERIATLQEAYYNKVLESKSRTIRPS